MPAILEFLAETPAALAAIPVTDRLSFVMGWYAFYFLFGLDANHLGSRTYFLATCGRC